MILDLRGQPGTLEELLKKYSTDLSREIILSICLAIDQGVDRITCMVIVTDVLKFEFTASRSYYAESLQLNMPPLIAIEEYETCALAVRYIKKLQQKYLVN